MMGTGSGGVVVESVGGDPFIGPEAGSPGGSGILFCRHIKTVYKLSSS